MHATIRHVMCRGRGIATGTLIALALQGAHAPDVRAQTRPFQEYNRNIGLTQIGALFPWGAGATGQGATIALVDSGVAAGHSDLAGRILPGKDFVDGGGAGDTSGASHGTFIAGVAVGKRNGGGIVGVAYNARIIPVRVNDSNNMAPSSRVAAGVNFAVQSGAPIINLARAGGPETGQSVQNALNSAAGAGRAVVMPAGNVGSGNPLFPGRFAQSMGGHGLIVGSLAPNGRISGFSNRAGGFADNFVVAPGEAVTSTTKNGGYSNSSGTSWATGYASGALALLLGAFPSLSPKDAIDILKSTANDLGAPGVDAVYGHGAINVRNALAPQGELSVPDTGGSGGAAGVVLVGALVVGGAMAWKRLRNKDDLKQALIHDRFGRGYTADVGTLIQPRDDDTGLDTAIAALRQTNQTAITQTGAGSTTTLSWSTDRVAGDPVRLDLNADDLDRDPADWSMRFDSGVVGGTQFSATRGAMSGEGFGADNNTDVDVSGFRRTKTFTGAHLGFAPGADSVSLGFGQGTAGDLKLGLLRTDEDERFGRVSETAAIEAGWNMTDRTRVSVTLSQTAEDGSLLGGAADGPLSVESATTTAIGVGARVKVGESSALVGSFSAGKTSVTERPGAMLRNVSDIDTNSWGIGLVSDDVLARGDRFGVAVSQPLRVTRGNATVVVPFSQTLGGDTLTRQSGWNMAPDGRETDLELFYQRPLDAKTRIGTWLLYQNAPFHAADQRDRISIFATVKRDF